MTERRDFVHLHVHSDYSLLDGSCQLEALLDRTKAEGMDAIALTDHGNLFGAVHFYKAAKERGIKPILGIEAYLAAGSRFDKSKAEEPGRRKKSTFHATLLARTTEGFQNLVRLSSTSWIDGLYRRPRMDRDALREWGRGLICLSGCLAGEVNQAILAGEMEGAERIIREYKELFGSENFYLEVMNHGMPEEDQVRAALVELGRTTGTPLVATNDIHYLDAPDWEVQDVVLCIGTGRLVREEDRYKMSTRQLWFKNADDMHAAFADLPQAIAATREIADRCSAEVALGRRYLPSFPPDPGETAEATFRRLCEAGLARLYRDVTPAIRDRLEYEIAVIVKTGFVDYFLIVWDFIRFAREQGIPVGPGRGSAAGSLVSYALGITRIDPLRYDLLFERFLNSERISMPDIDIDFCWQRREEVIEYVTKKYGTDRVAQIVTFGTLKSRAVIRDVGRVLEVPLIEVDRIAKKIPNGPSDTLEAALKNDEEVQRLYAASDENRRLFDIALKLEGIARNMSTHAAGVVITDVPLTERVPLCRSGDDVVTQWTMDVLEDIGLLKMDFLGLRTLTVIERAVRSIEKRTGAPFDVEALPLDDPLTYRLLQQGRCAGVFQLESDGMTELLKRLRPDRFEDLIAVLALYRPGPLGSGMVESYVKRKHGEEPISYLHPMLEPILKETLGVILYQEQVMRIANVLSGFSLNEADALRKAMGKKKPEILAKYHEQFLKGAERNGVPARVAAEIFDQIKFFAGYGFNKSHSAAYALITFQTAYLKAHEPLEFMAALLTCEMEWIDRTVGSIDELRAMGLKLLPPDVNKSYASFTVEDGAIRYGLAAIKGVGASAINVLTAARDAGGPFKSVFDLCERIGAQALNKGVLEALVGAGAMDGLSGNRAQKLAILEDALAVGASAERDRKSGQISLFAALDGEDAEDGASGQALPDLPELAEDVRLQREKDALGFYLTGHPLNRVQSALRRWSTCEIKRLSALTDRAPVTVGGIIRSVRLRPLKTGASAGSKMAVVELEDMTGVTEVTVPPKLWLDLGDRIVEDRIVFVKGEVSWWRERPNIRLASLIDLADAPVVLSSRVIVRLDGGDELEDQLATVKRVAREHAGPAPIVVELKSPEFGIVQVLAGDECRVKISAILLENLEKALGVDRVGVS
jgi:DNA polymerase-3 subunit alpha